MYKEILRYMGHKGDSDPQIKNLISSCLEKLNDVITPRHLLKLVPCKIENENIEIDNIKIKSFSLAEHLAGCESVYILTATLGAGVDRLIAQKSIVDSAEALCLQSCAAAKIEEYCDNIENELKIQAEKKDLFITSRYSPGYGDFNIEHQHDILKILNAQKQIGVTVTNSFLLTPLKTVTAIIGLKPLCPFVFSVVKRHNCKTCDKIDCQFRISEGSS